VRGLEVPILTHHDSHLSIPALVTHTWHTNFTYAHWVAERTRSCKHSWVTRRTRHACNSRGKFVANGWLLSEARGFVANGFVGYERDAWRVANGGRDVRFAGRNATQGARLVRHGWHSPRAAPAAALCDALARAEPCRARSEGAERRRKWPNDVSALPKAFPRVLLGYVGKSTICFSDLSCVFFSSVVEFP